MSLGYLPMLGRLRFGSQSLTYFPERAVSNPLQEILMEVRAGFHILCQNMT